jgi:ATP-dependent DNA helicase DinG
MSSTQAQLKPALDFFPLAKPRKPQEVALAFIEDAVADGYPDIVIAAPTGIGKSGVGAAAALWAGSFDCAGYNAGGYYLVTQKMLQDQLENDFPRWRVNLRTKGASLKSSSEYPCGQFGSCMVGGMVSADTKSGKKCSQRIDKSCPYVLAKWKFGMADVAVTNYPYLFTEHMYLGELPPRNIVVADECHTLERQIISFVEVLVNKETLDNWAPGARPVPKMSYIEDFVNWLKARYLMMCNERLNMLSENLSSGDNPNRRMQDEFNKLKNHVGRLSYAVEDMILRPDDWVFWQESVDGEMQCIAKPISADPFVPNLINEMGSTRIYMSAYPGPKDVFCRSLGLNPRQTAWLELDSTFPVDNRLVHMTTVGSMSRKWMDATLPHLLKMCETILEAHPQEKGIIHCHSYALGQKIYEYFRGTEMRRRVLFATKASERGANFNLHRVSPEPTVMLSPSIAEGFSFDDDLARFQIIAKVPYPYLGDRQVAAKMKIDRDWYTLQTVMTILQACGRIVRSDTDHGSTYILDHDFVRLFEENTKFFPKWFKDSFKFY